MPSPSVGTVSATNAVAALSAKVSAVPSRNIAAYTNPALTVSVAMVTVRPTTTTARAASTAALRSRRSATRSTTAPASKPKSSHGRRCMNTASATANGSVVMEASSSGAAASRTPSPRFPATAAAHSHRKSRPRLGGAIRSASRLTAASPSALLARYRPAVAGEEEKASPVRSGQSAHQHAPAVGEPPDRSSWRHPHHASSAPQASDRDGWSSPRGMTTRRPFTRSGVARAWPVRDRREANRLR